MLTPPHTHVGHPHRHATSARNSRKFSLAKENCLAYISVDPLESGVLLVCTQADRGSMSHDDRLLAAQKRIEETIKRILQDRNLKQDSPFRWLRFPDTTLFVLECQVDELRCTWSISEDSLLKYESDAAAKILLDQYLQQRLAVHRSPLWR
jgi:hypothetical protein